MATLTRNVIDSRINCCSSAGQFTLSLYEHIVNALALQQSYLLQDRHIKLSVHEGVLTLDDNIPLPAAEWFTRDVRLGTLPRFLLTERTAVPGIELNFIGTDDPRPFTEPPIHRISINSDGIFLSLQGGKIVVYIPPSAQEVIRYLFNKPCP